MNIFPNGLPTTIIMLLTVWRCVIVDCIGTKTVKEMIEMTFLITEDYEPKFDEEKTMVIVLKQCHEYFLKERFMVNFEEIMDAFVGVIMRIGFTKVHEFLEYEFKTKTNDFWNSIKKDIDEISLSFKSKVMPEIWEAVVNNDQNGKQKMKQLSASPSSLTGYNKQIQQEFQTLEKKQILEEKPLREELKCQAERVGAALLYTLIHMKMRLLYERNQVKNQFSIPKTSAKTIKSQIGKQMKRLEKAVTIRKNSVP
ncbi:hypothetical protein niasHS_008486 [Heterodera schachtii]|uniref:Uncharacterized protein n=1 Tax=Heterodera schachtii TaxID=97005 RepID=A0ABD2JER3_HETSC